MIQFTAWGQPATQGSMKAFARGKRAIVTHDSKKLAPWRRIVSKAAKSAMATVGPLDGPLSLSVAFYLVRPQSVRRPRPHCKPDLDKLVRAVNDSLEGIVFHNDSQVVAIEAFKSYAREPGEARVEIEVVRACADA